MTFAALARTTGSACLALRLVIRLAFHIFLSHTKQSIEGQSTGTRWFSVMLCCSSVEASNSLCLPVRLLLSFAILSKVTQVTQTTPEMVSLALTCGSACGNRLLVATNKKLLAAHETGAICSFIHFHRCNTDPTSELDHKVWRNYPQSSLARCCNMSYDCDAGLIILFQPSTAKIMFGAQTRR